MKIPPYEVRVEINTDRYMQESNTFDAIARIAVRAPDKTGEIAVRILPLRLEDILVESILEKMLDNAKYEILRFVQRLKEEEDKKQRFLDGDKQKIIDALLTSSCPNCGEELP